MGKLGGSSQIIAGIAIVIVGILIQSAIFEFLLDVIGVILIIGGIVIGVMGLIKMLKGKDSNF